MSHKIILCADVFTACLTHALSTEREEIMGLLFGEWVEVYVSSGGTIDRPQQ